LVLGVHPWIRHVRLAGLANLLLGAFLLRWPAALPVPLQDGPLQRSLEIVGGLVVVCSAVRALFPQRCSVLSAVNFVCGIWILLSPVVFESAMTGQMVIESVAAGIGLMAFAWWSIAESHDARNSTQFSS
jgi:hypothetical protein